MGSKVSTLQLQPWLQLRSSDKLEHKLRWLVVAFQVGTGRVVPAVGC